MAELKKLAALGELTGATLVWRDGEFGSFLFSSWAAHTNPGKNKITRPMRLRKVAAGLPAWTPARDVAGLATQLFGSASALQVRD